MNDWTVVEWIGNDCLVKRKARYHRMPIYGVISDGKLVSEHRTKKKAKEKIGASSSAG